jgi:hypothetical protein
MLLSVGERLVLLSVLPKEGNFITLKLVRELRENLSFSEDEHKKYKFRQEEGNVFWENNNDEADIKIGEKAADVIAEALKELDKQKKLKNEHYSIYEKFIK